METFSRIVDGFNRFIWGFPLLILLTGCHLYLTVRLKFIQRYIPLGIKLSLQKDPDATGNISPFGALAIALAATIGTGNIVGVSTAVVIGGPGAVFWCWVCGVLGIATKYAESVLAVKYRVRGSDGMLHGGAMYAIERGMKNKFLAVLFAVFTLTASFGIGNLAQSNAVATFSNEAFGVPFWAMGVGEAVVIALVILGGLGVISKVCSALVPLMAVFYVGCCAAILFICRGSVVPALQLIVSEAFSTKAVTGGLSGTAIMLAMRYGIARGLFSNESGMGSAPIIAASAKTRNSVRQALISASGTFWDTVCVCAVTGTTLVAAALHCDPQADFRAFDAPELTRKAFELLPAHGMALLAVAMGVFAITTILGWVCYGEQAMHYLGGSKAIPVFKLLFVVMVYVGAVVKLDLVWNISDIANGFMVIPNVICIFALNHVVVKETRRYLNGNSINDRDDELI